MNAITEKLLRLRYSSVTPVGGPGGPGGPAFSTPSLISPCCYSIPLSLPIIARTCSDICDEKGGEKGCNSNTVSLEADNTPVPPGPPGPDDSFLTLPRLVLDLETYYDAEYSLEKCDAVEYVSDSRFLVHGMAVRHPDGRTGFHPDVDGLLADLRREYGDRLERVVTVFHNANFDYLILRRKYGLEPARMADTMLMSRLLFGGKSGHSLRKLAGRFGLTAKGDLGFMKWVRTPTREQLERLEAYAITDVAITEMAAEKMFPRMAALGQEIWAMDHAIRMFVERPLRIDAGKVSDARRVLDTTVEAAIRETGRSAEVISSSSAFEALLRGALFETGRQPPMKDGKNGKILDLSKGSPERERLLNDADPKVRALVTAKVRQRESAAHRGRLDRLGAAVSKNGGQMPCVHNYCGAVTGRYTGGGGFNIQNLKKASYDSGEEDIARLLRESITAPDGCLLVSADASQIEARVLAFLAGQDDLHGAFAKGEDVYSVFASAHLGCEVRKPDRRADPPELCEKLTTYRQIGKQAILGLGYGMGVGTFIDRLRQRPEIRPLFDRGVLGNRACAGIVYGYREQYPAVPKFWADCERAVRLAAGGGIETVCGIRFDRDAAAGRIHLPSGRALVYPNLRIECATYRKRKFIDRDGNWSEMEDDSPRIVYNDGDQALDLYGGKIVENIVQAYARDLLVHVMFTVERVGFPVYVHCHDSITVTAPAAKADEATCALLRAWRDPPEWARGLALDAEAKTGVNLAQV